MCAFLLRVGIETAERHEENTRAEIGGDQLGHGLEFLAETISRISGLGLILITQRFQSLGGVRGSGGGLAEKIERGVFVGTLCRDFLNQFSATFAVSDWSSPAIQLEGIDTSKHGHAHLVPEKGSRKSIGSHRESSQASGVFLLGFVEGSSQPAGPAKLFVVGTRRVPDVHGTKMRAIRIGITHTLNDAERAVVVETFHPAHLRMQPKFVIELKNCAFLDLGSRTRLEVGIVRERNDSIESIVSTSQFDENENAPVLIGSLFCCSSAQKSGCRSTQGHYPGGGAP